MFSFMLKQNEWHLCDDYFGKLFSDGKQYPKKPSTYPSDKANHKPAGVKTNDSIDKSSSMPMPQSIGLCIILILCFDCINSWTFLGCVKTSNLGFT